MDRLRRENGRSYTFSDDALRLMMDYDWPGNVRELEHSIERACALSSGPVLHVSGFPSQLRDRRENACRQQAIVGSTSGEPNQVLSIAEVERQAILNAISQVEGDKLKAARLLGIGKTTLYRKLQEYSLGSDNVTIDV